jgi:DNA processing protein
LSAAATAQTVERIRLARTDGVGPITYRRLLQRFGSAEAAIDALPRLAESGGAKQSPTVPLAALIRSELDRVARLGGRMLVWGDPDYPPLLAQAEDAPVVLAVLGDVAALSRRAVAVVGSRNASANGQRLAETLARDLALDGMVVVSGMARGIDAAAHTGAMREGETVACVAGGLDQPYPPEHASLQAAIAGHGAVVTEAPIGTAPQARHFPRRNRIIAALSLGVVVVEAALRSGSLTTARMALDYDRDLFAVPGSPLDPRCRGANDLIRQGARLTETAADVLEGLRPPAVRRGLSEEPARWTGPPKSAAVDDRAQLAAVRLLPNLMSPAPTSVDDLVRRCQLPAAVVNAALLDLELAGRVEMLPGNRVALLIEPEAYGLRP